MPAEDGENAVKILHRNRQLCIVICMWLFRLMARWDLGTKYWKFKP